MNKNDYTDKYISHANIPKTFNTLKQVHKNLTDLYLIITRESSKNTLVAKKLKDIINDYDKYVFNTLIKNFNSDGFNYKFFVKESKVNKTKKEVIISCLKNIKKLNNNRFLFNETKTFLKTNQILTDLINKVIKKIY